MFGQLLGYNETTFEQGQPHITCSQAQKDEESKITLIIFGNNDRIDIKK